MEKNELITVLVKALDKSGASDIMQLKVAAALAEEDPERSMELFFSSEIHILMIIKSFYLVVETSKADINKLLTKIKNQEGSLRRKRKVIRELTAKFDEIPLKTKVSNDP